VPKVRSKYDAYAGFIRRLVAKVLDWIVLLPLHVSAFWVLPEQLFVLYFLAPVIVIDAFFNIYLLGRFGATPGLFICSVRIVAKLGPLSYGRAFVRYVPDLILIVASQLTLILAFHNLWASVVPYVTLNAVGIAWDWGELMSIPLDRQRRSLRDFLADTRAIRTSFLPRWSRAREAGSDAHSPIPNHQPTT